jgi:hypothetical protein
MLFSDSQDTKRPTPAGINISGIIFIRKVPVLFTCSIRITFVYKAKNMRIKPYMLAGTGKGIKCLNASPIKETASIIPNCRIYFKIKFLSKLVVTEPAQAVIKIG